MVKETKIYSMEGMCGFVTSVKSRIARIDSSGKIEITTKGIYFYQDLGLVRLHDKFHQEEAKNDFPSKIFIPYEHIKHIEPNLYPINTIEKIPKNIRPEDIATHGIEWFIAHGGKIKETHLNSYVKITTKNKDYLFSPDINLPDEPPEKWVYGFIETVKNKETSKLLKEFYQKEILVKKDLPTKQYSMSFLQVVILGVILGAIILIIMNIIGLT